MLLIKMGRRICKFIKNNKYMLALVFFSFLYATDASADGMFSQLNSAGETIFKGLSQIIFKAAGIGVACVCIAGMFGNFNWKWLAAILIGVFIIGMAVHGGVDQGVDMFAGD